MLEYFELEKYVKEAIKEYPKTLDILKKSNDPMLAVAISLHTSLEKLGDDWSGFRCGMVTMYVYLKYAKRARVKELTYIS